MDTILNTKDASNDYKQDDQINNIKFSDRSTTSISDSILLDNFFSSMPPLFPLDSPFTTPTNISRILKLPKDLNYS